MLLRQQNHYSQEDVAKRLNISRQTVSKWESDLSLPDMKMMLDIAALYNISITELLGIDDGERNDSIEQIYEQTNVVLNNIHKENKKRKNRDIVIMVIICITCLIFIVLSIMLITKVTRLENRSPNQTIIKYPTAESEKIVNQLEEVGITEIDLDKKEIKVNYRCTLNQYDEETSVQLIFVDINKEEHLYDMYKENENSFVYNGTIPLADYEYKKVIVTFKDKTKKMENNLDSSQYYLSQTIKNMFHLEILRTNNGRFKKELNFYTDFSRLMGDDKITYLGTLKENVHLSILKDKKDGSGADTQVIQSKDFPFDKKTKIELKEGFKNGEFILYEISINVDGYNVQLNGSEMLLVNSYYTNPLELIDASEYSLSHIID